MLSPLRITQTASAAEGFWKLLSICQQWTHTQTFWLFLTTLFMKNVGSQCCPQKGTDVTFFASFEDPNYESRLIVLQHREGRRKALQSELGNASAGRSFWRARSCLLLQVFADNNTCKGTVVTFSSRCILYAVTLLAKLNCFPKQNELSQQKGVWGEYSRVSIKMFPT